MSLMFRLLMQAALAGVFVLLPVSQAPWEPSFGAWAQVSSDESPPSETDDAESSVQNDASGLPLPRFVSLRSNQVNLRAGPGVRYPVEWVYVRRDLPVEIVAEFDTWRRIRDWQGTEGWVHQSMLSGRRTMVVIGDVRTLRRDPSDSAQPVALLEPNVVGRLLQCPGGGDFCRVEVMGYQGWLRRGDFWGIHRGETVN